MQYSDDELNLLYAKSLEWGEHRLRPIIKWAQKLWPEWDAEKQAEISDYINAVCSKINDHIDSTYDRKAEKFTESGEQCDSWIKSQYPWMTSENIGHGKWQGMYYAWHG